MQLRTSLLTLFVCAGGLAADRCMRAAGGAGGARAGRLVEFRLVLG